jgi:hypothetical protein
MTSEDYRVWLYKFIIASVWRCSYYFVELHYRMGSFMISAGVR